MSYGIIWVNSPPLNKVPFPLIVLIGFPSVREKKRDWSLHSTVYVQWLFLHPYTLFYKSQRWRCVEMHREPNTKITQHPTVNEFEIVVLLRQFLVSTGKEKAMMQRVFLSAPTCFRHCNNENAWNWVFKLVLKYHDNPTVNESEIVILLRQIWVYVGKREGFVREKEKTKLRGRGGVEVIVGLKIDLTCRYL